MSHWPTIKRDAERGGLFIGGFAVRRVLATLGLSAVAAFAATTQIPSSSHPLHGIDFAWSCPSPSGRDFGASYLSNDLSKNWSRSCVDSWHRAGKGTVAVWESSSTRATQGYSAGYSDAKQAASQLVILGAPANQSFDIAIDCDCSGQSVAAYFHGASVAEPGRVNAYGGYYPLLYLSQHGLVGHLNWQTYAWSRGLWLAASVAPLEQDLNGSAVDYDRAIAPDYGQWPDARMAVVPKVPKAKYRAWQRALAATRRAYDQRGCSVLSQRISWFGAALRRHPRTRTQYRRDALGASQRASKQRACHLLSQRSSWFSKQLAAHQP